MRKIYELMTLNYGVYNIYLHIGIATPRAGEINGVDGPGVEHGDGVLIAENKCPSLPDESAPGSRW